MSKICDEVVKRIIEDMLTTKIIKSAYGLFDSKCSKESWPVLHNYPELGKCTEADKFPIPRIEHTVWHLMGNVPYEARSICWILASTACRDCAGYNEFNLHIWNFLIR